MDFQREQNLKNKRRVDQFPVALAGNVPGKFPAQPKFKKKLSFASQKLRPKKTSDQIDWLLLNSHGPKILQVQLITTAQKFRYPLHLFYKLETLRFSIYMKFFL